MLGLGWPSRGRLSVSGQEQHPSGGLQGTVLRSRTRGDAAEGAVVPLAGTPTSRLGAQVDAGGRAAVLADAPCYAAGLLTRSKTASRNEYSGLV